MVDQAGFFPRPAGPGAILRTFPAISLAVWTIIGGPEAAAGAANDGPEEGAYFASGRGQIAGTPGRMAASGGRILGGPQPIAGEGARFAGGGGGVLRRRVRVIAKGNFHIAIAALCVPEGSQSPGGTPEISRWWSAAEPPDYAPH